MKKVGIVLVNIILIIFVLIFAEIMLFKNATKDITYHEVKYRLEKEDLTLEKLKKYSNMREPRGLNYKKSPIIIYGCSYAYGDELKDEETFSSQLSEYTKRPVYNFAMSSKGLQHALYLLKHDKKITPEPEYVFYVFINDHYRRMFVNCNRIDNLKYLTYKKKNNELIENVSNFAITERFYILSSLKNQMYYFLKAPFEKQIYKLAKLYFITIKNEIKNKYPNAKFVILDYELGYSCYLSKDKIKDLQKEDIDVISLNKEFKDKLSMNEYRNPKEIDEYRHPNAKAWSEIVEFISKKYDL